MHAKNRSIKGTLSGWSLHPKAESGYLPPPHRPDLHSSTLVSAVSHTAPRVSVLKEVVNVTAISVPSK